MNKDNQKLAAAAGTSAQPLPHENPQGWTLATSPAAIPLSSVRKAHTMKES